jgi:siroheme synthase (precorrin-2 oxidase/ferrochelatase)
VAARRKRETLVIPFPPAYPVFHNISERDNISLIGQGSNGDKLSFMITTGAFMTVASPDIIAEWSKQTLNQHYIVHISIRGDHFHPDKSLGGNDTAPHTSVCFPPSQINST